MKVYAPEKPEKDFWGELDISVDDALEFEQSKKRTWLTLHSKMSKFPGWFEVINREESKKRNFKEYFKHQFKKYKINFYRNYFLCQFASVVDTIAIKERLPDEIRSKYSQELENGIFSYQSMLYPIYKLNKELLVGIFYDSLINKASMKMFEFNSTVQLDFIEKLNNKIIQKHLQTLQDDGTIRRNFQLWWFDKKEDRTKVLIRTESKRRSSIHQVAQNTFLKTAGDKIMVFSDNGKKLEVLSKEAPTVAKWASMIVSKVIQKEVKYIPIPNQHESDKIFKFLIDIQQGKIDNVSLIGIEVKNTILINSPTISLDSSESISESLTELQNKHKITLLNSIEDINHVILIYDDITYKLLLNTENGITTISFDNRNLHEPEKNKFYEILNANLG
ncbi:MAG: hypothetical protein HRU07_05165 [Nitrosopumilus sp.]|nr:hypothetical protein [Nitrosopumilus sp.]NRA05538.1 hypothetical protein [Nitrosopumilus sp.]